MKTLIAFLISGDGDFGALEFEQSGITIQQAYDAIPEGGHSVRAEDMDEEGDWEVEIAYQIHNLTEEMAKEIMSMVNTIAGENGCGDYDHLKHRNYDFLTLDTDTLDTAEETV